MSCATPVTSIHESTAERLAPAPHGPTRRRILITALLILLVVGGLYFLVPRLAGLNQTWGRLQHGNPLWLGVAAIAEMLSIAGYAVLFRTVFGRDMPLLGWRASVEIPLAGIAALRLLATGGAAAVAVTAWALERAGMRPRVVACRMIASLFLQYGVFLGAVCVAGLAVGFRILPGRGPFELTFLPAVLSIAVAATVLSAVFLPNDFERRIESVSGGPRWWRRLLGRLAAAPTALGDGARTAVSLVRERRPGLLGAIAYWGFDIAALGLCFVAFGGHPAVAIVVLAYFIGQLGSLLPLPGGIGGVEGAMIGSFAAFGVSTDQAIVSVLAYRAISFWLPTLPGILGYVLLRRTVRAWQRQRAAEPA